MQVVSTNIAVPHDHSVRRYPTTGIDKHPVDALEVAAPGPNYGDGSGVSGDFVGDSDFHGGAHKAVYAYAREELDFWETELARPLRSGMFGENLTTSGVVLRDLARVLLQDLRDLVIGPGALDDDVAVLCEDVVGASAYRAHSQNGDLDLFHF